MWSWQIVDFADPRVKLKETENKGEYLDRALEF